MRSAHTFNATMKARSSSSLILYFLVFTQSGNFSLKYSGLDQPQHIDKDASVEKMLSGFSQFTLGITEIPSNSFMKVSHQLTSIFSSDDNIRLPVFGCFVMSSMMRLTKTLPALTALQAKLSFPSNCCNSLRVADFLVSILSTSCRVQVVDPR